MPMSGDVNLGLRSSNPFLAQYSDTTVQAPQQVTQYAGNPNFQGGLENDTFQRSEGPGLVSAVGLTGVGCGLGAAAGYYWKGNPLNKVEDGYALKDGFTNTYDAQKFDEYVNKIVEKRKLNALSSLGITDLKQYEAIEKLAKGEELTDELKTALPKDIKTADEAKAFMQKAAPKLEKVNPAHIREVAKKSFEENYSKSAVQAKIKNYTAMEEELTKLGKNATPEQLQEFIAKNKDKFGIKNSKKLKNYTDKLLKLNQEELLQELKKRNNGFKTTIKEFQTEILSHVDSETGLLKEGAPKNIKAMFKNFRLAELKRYGLWGAGIGFGAWIMNKVLGSK